MINSIYQRLLNLKIIIDNEELDRSKIIYSDAYVDLNKQIDILKAQQEAMILELNDSRKEYDDVKREFMDIMRSQDILHFKNAVAKVKERKEVNRSRVLNVIDGDMDNYIAMSNITQVALKDFAKGHPLKNELMDCIEVTGTEIVDLEFITDPA